MYGKITDDGIIDLFWQRNELAISLSQERFGSVCFALSHRILDNKEDAEECVNDTWMRAWNAMPPERPYYLRAFFLKIVRNLSLNKLSLRCANKRGRGQTDVVLDELQDCIPAPGHPEDIIFAKELSSVISTFLKGISRRDAAIFLRRYFYVQSLHEIADAVNLTEAIVATILSRTRKKLRIYLKEEYDI